MQKKVYILFVGLFLAIFLLGIISAESCDIRLRTECQESPWNNILLGLSDFTNAHGELWDEGNYDYVLCCDFVRTHDCSGTNKIIGLSSDTNAHAEIPSLNNYGVDVCYGDLSCRSTTENCFSYEIGMISLSDETNAHIGGFDDYETKICCASSICGNNIIEGTEECDDGNNNNDDACSNICRIDERGWSIPLYSNKINLISIPLMPENKNIEVVFDGIKGDVERVWAYQYDDKSGENKWSFYTPTIGDLEEIIPGYGYFVFMKNNNTLYGIGKDFGVESPPQVTLITSWNLIGHYGLLPLNLDNALGSLKDYVSGVFGLNEEGDNFTPVEGLEPTKGYWLSIPRVGTENPDEILFFDYMPAEYF